MYKIFSLILVIAIVFTCCACGGKTENDNSSYVSKTESIASSEIESPEDIEMKKHLPSDMEFSENKIDYIGRFENKNGGYEFAWSGSTIRAGFVGTGISAKLKLVSMDNKYSVNDFLEVIVDGKTQKTLSVSKSPKLYTLAEGLEYGYHYVELVKRTDVLRSLVGFYGFDYKDGLAAFAPKQKDRKIEFIGDSITAGWGNLSSYQTSEFILSEQDATKSYGYLVAKNLEAEVVLTAISGGGVVINSGGSTPGQLPEFWKSYAYQFNTKQYDFSLSKQPDAVVINLGTNDYLANVEDTEFLETYISFIKDIRKQYPNAYILCTIGAMTFKPYPMIEQAVAKLTNEGLKNISAYEIKVKMNSNEMIGAVGHPSALWHEKAAEEITNVLKQKLGW